MARFRLATSESYIDKQGKQQTHTQWHSIVCWRKEAQYAQWNFRTGSLVRIEGRLRSKEINPELPLNKQTPYEIIATKVQLMTNDALVKPSENHTPDTECKESSRQSQSQSEIPQAPLDVDKLPF